MKITKLQRFNNQNVLKNKTYIIRFNNTYHDYNKFELFELLRIELNKLNVDVNEDVEDILLCLSVKSNEFMHIINII
jgi:hypothetical protein